MKLSKLTRVDKRGRPVCVCGGYHFPHRKGGGACEHSPTADYHHALRQGMPKEEALQLLWSHQLEKIK